MLFPGRNFHFGRPKTNFSCFKKWREREKKKKSSAHFHTIFRVLFQFSTSPFIIFFLLFSICPFFPSLFSPWKTSGGGGHSALPATPHLGCYATVYMVRIPCPCWCYCGFVNRGPKCAVDWWILWQNCKARLRVQGVFVRLLGSAMLTWNFFFGTLNDGSQHQILF